MKLENVEVAAVAYVLAVAVAGVATGMRSPAVWTAVAAFALLPAGAMLALWRQPGPTRS